MRRGDDRTVRVTATWPEDVPELGVSEGDPYDLTGKRVSFEGRFSRDEEDPFLLKTTDVGGGVEVRPAPAENVCLVEITSDDTKTLGRSITFKVDVRVFDPTANTRWTVARGDLWIEI